MLIWCGNRDQHIEHKVHKYTHRDVCPGMPEHGAMLSVDQFIAHFAAQDDLDELRARTKQIFNSIDVSVKCFRENHETRIEDLSRHLNGKKVKQ